MYSPLESDRFGLRIGRIDLHETGHAELLAALGQEHFDIVIVRFSADDVRLPALLAVQGGFRAVAADTLMYWDWSAPPSFRPDAFGRVQELVDPVTIEGLTSTVFADYSNHYAANPLLSREGALAGYCEWAMSLVTSGASSFLISGEVEDPAGFGIVDWSIEVPDIRLAGVMPAHRGRGAYRELLGMLMAEAVRRDRPGLQISTQAHNTQVMRAWADHGWRPRQAFLTFHLIRDELLAADRDAWWTEG